MIYTYYIDNIFGSAYLCSSDVKLDDLGMPVAKRVAYVDCDRYRVSVISKQQPLDVQVFESEAEAALWVAGV